MLHGASSVLDRFNSRPPPTSQTPSAPSYLLRDRDQVYGQQFRHRLKAMGINESSRCRPDHSFGTRTISMRRFLARPSGVALSATGLNSPNAAEDRKSTRLNSSHQIISYAVF